MKYMSELIELLIFTAKPVKTGYLCYSGQLSAKIKGLTRSGWPIMQMSYLVNDWKY